MKYFALSLLAGLVSISNSLAILPTIGLRSPVTNASFYAGPNLTLLSSGSDPDGFIAKVEFYQGATKLGQTTNGSAAVTNFTMIWSNVPAGAYSLTAVATDNAGGATTSAPVSMTISALPSNSMNLVPAESVWKYKDDGADQGTAWRNPGFADSGWASGAAQIGYGDGDEITTVGFGSDANNKFVTTYFRKTFVVTNASSITNLLLNVIRDDGVVVYLNGTAIFTNNMLAGYNYLSFTPTSIGG